MFLNSTEIIDDVLVIKPPSEKPKDNFWSTLTQGVNSALRIYNRQRIVDENFNRVRRGQNPINTRREPNTIIPNIQIDDNTRNTGLMIAAGIGGVILLLALTGRKGD